MPLDYVLYDDDVLSYVHRRSTKGKTALQEQSGNEGEETERGCDNLVGSRGGSWQVRGSRGSWQSSTCGGSGDTGGDDRAGHGCGGSGGVDDTGRDWDDDDDRGCGCGRSELGGSVEGGVGNGSESGNDVDGDGGGVSSGTGVYDDGSGRVDGGGDGGSCTGTGPGSVRVETGRTDT